MGLSDYINSHPVTIDILARSRPNNTIGGLSKSINNNVLQTNKEWYIPPTTIENMSYFIHGIAGLSDWYGDLYQMWYYSEDADQIRHSAIRQMVIKDSLIRRLLKNNIMKRGDNK